VKAGGGEGAIGEGAAGEMRRRDVASGEEAGDEGVTGVEGNFGRPSLGRGRRGGS